MVILRGCRVKSRMGELYGQEKKKEKGERALPFSGQSNRGKSTPVWERREKKKKDTRETRVFCCRSKGVNLLGFYIAWERGREGRKVLCTKEGRVYEGEEEKKF